MKLLNYIRPKWKHSDWEVRIKAVADLSEIKDLSWVVQNDKHELVRAEAARRLNDQDFIAEVIQRKRSLYLACFICILFCILFKYLSVPTNTGGSEQPNFTNLSLDFVDDIISGMEFGNIAFNVPSTLMLGDETIIELLLACETSIDELKQSLIAVGEKEGYRIRIANDMQACLWGRGFQCKAIMPQEQAISTSASTLWKWDVKAIKGGSQKLHLTLSTNLYVNNHVTQYAIKTFEREISIKVTWRKYFASFINSYWQWIITAMLFPTIVWSTNKWTKMRLRSKNNAMKKPRIIVDS